MKCRFCSRERSFPCMSTRDMEDMAVDSDDQHCFDALDSIGGGERGIDRVSAIREERRKAKAAA